MGKRLDEFGEHALPAVKNLFLVGGVILSYFGAEYLSGWSSRDLLEGVAPIVLGAFSIFMAFTTLLISIRENRKRSGIERDQSVRPIILLDSGWDPTSGSFVEMSCTPYQLEEGERGFQTDLKIENVGLGVALEMHLFIVTLEGEIHAVRGVLPKVRVGQIVNISLHHTLLTEIGHIVTRCRDTYGNEVFSQHTVDPFEGPSLMDILQNHTFSFESEYAKEVFSERFRDVVPKTGLPVQNTEKGVVVG